eukprot:TRINITY_DN37902_c0_g1_i1.p1 TRINITY_DN37902_c0_g1~~TRINITY_DN37902_c0_g1_i1.p1  ORF type:complete len:621 (+),score=104.99 TRINITY_DN37902_c0_g1_i1:325-2187(+)
MVKVQLQISSELAGHVIGRGGARITDIRKDTGAQVKIEREEIAGFRSASIGGTKQQVTRCVDMVFDSSRDNKTTCRVLLPSGTVGDVIGRGGENINLIRRESGAKIKIDKAKNQDSLRTVEVKGKIDDLRRALVMIVSKVGDEQLHKGNDHVGYSPYAEGVPSSAPRKSNSKRQSAYLSDEEERSYSRSPSRDVGNTSSPEREPSLRFGSSSTLHVDPSISPSTVGDRGGSWGWGRCGGANGCGGPAGCAGFMGCGGGCVGGCMCGGGCGGGCPSSANLGGCGGCPIGGGCGFGAPPSNGFGWVGCGGFPGASGWGGSGKGYGQDLVPVGALMMGMGCFPNGCGCGAGYPPAGNGCGGGCCDAKTPQAQDKPPGLIVFGCSNRIAGRLIGKGGNIITDIRKASGARFKVEECARRDCGERFVSIDGDQDQVERCLEEVFSTLDQRSQEVDDNPTLEVVLMVPNHQVGAMVGRGGENIKTTRERSGAHVKLDQNKDRAADRLMTVNGRPLEVKRALVMMAQSLFREGHVGVTSADGDRAGSRGGNGDGGGVDTGNRIIGAIGATPKKRQGRMGGGGTTSSGDMTGRDDTSGRDRRPRRRVFGESIGDGGGDDREEKRPRGD